MPPKHRRLSCLTTFGLCFTLALITWAAAASESAAIGPSDVLFITQIVLLLLIGRVLGEVMQRAGQSGVMGQLLAGIILSPSVFGALWPGAQHAVFAGGREQKAMIEAISSLGILMLLLLTGMETDLELVKKARRAAVSVSVAGIIVPFACGMALGQFLPEVMLPQPPAPWNSPPNRETTATCLRQFFVGS
jgi:hypothetical protein